MGVHVVAVAVLVLVLDVLMLVLGVGVLVHGAVGMRVLVAVWMLVAMLIVGVGQLSSSGAWGPLGAIVARPHDGKVGEARVVAGEFSDAAADRVELPGFQRPHRPAPLAVEVFPLALADKHVQAGTVAEVDVAHEPVTFERLKVAIHRGEVDPKSPGDVLRRYRSLGCEQGAEDEPSRGREPQASCS